MRAIEAGLQMSMGRLLLAAAVTVALAGCASGYGGYYGGYPSQAYYDPYYAPYPYYGGYGLFGYNSAFDHDFDHRRHRFFQPDDHVKCDRKRDLCYDRYGPSYTATKRYFGERDANAAFHKYGDKVVEFSPAHGVTCDRRARTCSDEDGFDKGLSERFFGDRAGRRGAAMAPMFPNHEQQDDATKRQPDRRASRSSEQDRPPSFDRQRQAGPATDDNDDDSGPRLLPQRLNQRTLADDERVGGSDSNLPRRLQIIRPDRPDRASNNNRPRLLNNARPGGCPPRGCAND